MKIPKDFIPENYLQLNPDLVNAAVDPFKHYEQFGINEGRLYRSPQLIDCGKINAKLENILVVTHEASLTGAPVLTYNIIKRLSTKYNVILLLLGGGLLIPEFQKTGVCYIVCINQRVNTITKIESAVSEIINNYKLKFAILNSVECSSVVEFLAKKFIAITSLIHEFTSYTRPLDNMGRVLFWSTELIFSSQLIYENACLYFPDLVNRKIKIIPQGKCLLPKNSISNKNQEDHKLFDSIFKTKDMSTKKKIILGVGSVHIRKGIDHFIECANILASYDRLSNWKFIWIGKGYDPEKDGNYSIFLKDQIERSGLCDRLSILGETDEITKAYEQSNILVIPSRLDPMPNVALDAISLGIPVICFDKATGLAEILKQENLGEYCVAEYMNTRDMADKIIKIIDCDDIKNIIYDKFKEIYAKYFEFEKYISIINEISIEASNKAKQNKKDTEVILSSELFETNMGAFIHLTNSAIEDQVISYVNSWSVGLGPPRKGIRGFHPGIYSDANHLKEIGINPFSHYISSGMPVGIWNYKVISSENQRDKIYLPADGNVALHIHVFYVEIFHDIVLRILENKIRPDIFITVTNSKEIEIIEKLLVDNKLNVTSIDLVDNIGRNIKPLIDIYNKKIKGKYKYVGHIHTKKSPYNGHEMGAAWGNSILNNLLGNKKAPMLDLILNEMEIENKIGIVVPEDPNIVGWDKNIEAAKKILNDLEIKEELPINFNFPIGAMFIARDVAIKFIDNPKLKNLDYPKEPVPRDGTVLHAIERLMGFTNEPFILSAAYLEGTKR